MSTRVPAPRPFAPRATIENLRHRADLLQLARNFLRARGYWEVETPLLSADCCVDAHLDPLTTQLTPDGAPLYLQTSPEFAMKRLLAAGSGSIFQITRAFRAGEAGNLHNPEFTMIEWYRVDGSYHDLMTEVGELVGLLLNAPPAQRLSYRAAFRQYAGIDPLDAPTAELELLARPHSTGFTDRDDLLNLLLATLVEPHLGTDTPTFLYDFPATQAALARVRPETPPVAERFELYFHGLELCNGYQELLDAGELRARNRRQNERRVALGKPAIPEDSRLLAALEHGLPPCAGVAVGFDRLAMLALGTRTVQEVLAFPIDCC